MVEHNFWFRVRYGFTEALHELEWTFAITTPDLEDEERLLESFREFIRNVKEERDGYRDPRS